MYNSKVPNRKHFPLLAKKIKLTKIKTPFVAQLTFNTIFHNVTQDIKLNIWITVCDSTAESTQNFQLTQPTADQSKPRYSNSATC